MSRETAKRAKRVLKAMGKTSDIAGSEMILPNTSGDHVRSIKRAAPVDDKDLVNKEYVDSKEVESFPTSITSGSVIFSDGTNLAEDNFNLFWNSATNELQSHHIKIVSDGSQASPALKFNDTNTGFFKSGDSIRTSINNSTKMTVDATGVGIGTANPLDVLHIGAGNNLGITITSTNAPILRLYTSAGVASARNWAIMTTQVEQGDFLIRQSNAKGGNPQSAGTTRFYIDNSGNVGIGTTSPLEKLEVAGAVMSSGSQTLNTGSSIKMDWTGAGGRLISFGADASTAGTFTFMQRASDGNPSNVPMFIDALGNVGIGTLTPQNKLNVIGDGNFTGIVYGSNLFIPQYIFSHTNETIPLTTSSVWANVTFGQEVTDIIYGITHVHAGITNHTFTFSEDGIYEIHYDFDVEDTSPSASDIDVAGRVIYENGTEIPGSVFETDIIKQDIETELSHDFLMSVLDGDKIVFQFVADDVDVQISTHGTFGVAPESATVVIKKIANL